MRRRFPWRGRQPHDGCREVGHDERHLNGGAGELAEAVEELPNEHDEHRDENRSSAGAGFVIELFCEVGLFRGRSCLRASHRSPFAARKYEQWARLSVQPRQGILSGQEALDVQPSIHPGGLKGKPKTQPRRVGVLLRSSMELALSPTAPGSGDPTRGPA